MIWWNDRLVEQLSIDPQDRGLLLGDGIFETILVRNKQAIFLEDHLSRLSASAAFLDLPVPKEIKKGINQLLAGFASGAEGVLRITLSRGMTCPELWPDRAPQPSLLISLRPYRRDDRPASFYIVKERRFSGSRLANMKTLNYLPQILAQREAKQAGADEALMENEHGNLACGARANLFLLIDGILKTPPQSEGVLPGIMRGKILAIAKENGLPFEEEPLAREDLEKAEEAFITNSLFLLRPLQGKEGTRCDFLKAALWQKVEGQAKR